MKCNSDVYFIYTKSSPNMKHTDHLPIPPHPIVASHNPQSILNVPKPCVFHLMPIVNRNAFKIIILTTSALRR